ncbi:MAG: MFS transporter [Actinophytocola sp.]|uniref:MFS transporter n=1 Tax=Actinophytocola sp. TaxID=1872138 RepID=UPI00132849D2|nr:MFS transporter [Actinophytocola sp.]MPZ86237.1 MFS transporter [Actinophytocola sp.]
MTASTTEDDDEERERWLTPGVGGVGAASFFSDTGHEVTTAVLPSFLTTTLGASAGVLGIIEGISDALTGVMKLIGAPMANDPAKRGRVASGGYLGTALATGAIGAAATVWQAGLLRAAAWLSRGLRSPARDSMLTSLAPRSAYGRAFGVERAGDNLGAVAGPLLAAGLVAWVGIRPTLYLAAIPGVFAVVAITIAAREARTRIKTAPVRSRRRLHLGELRRAGLARALLPVALFELGNVATTLLILRATELLTTPERSVAAATSLAVLIYASHNAVAAVVALFGGRWLDRAGPRVVFAAGAALYVLAYSGFALSLPSPASLVVAFALAGAGIGLAETAESTLVARLLPDRLRGSGFGVLGIVQSGGDLLASAVVGLLYALVSPTVAFGYAAAWMVLSLVAASIVRPKP